MVRAMLLFEMGRNLIRDWEAYALIAQQTTTAIARMSVVILRGFFTPNIIAETGKG